MSKKNNFNELQITEALLHFYFYFNSFKKVEIISLIQLIKVFPVVIFSLLIFCLSSPA